MTYPKLWVQRPFLQQKKSIIYILAPQSLFSRDFIIRSSPLNMEPPSISSHNIIFAKEFGKRQQYRNCFVANNKKKDVYI